MKLKAGPGRKPVKNHRCVAMIRVAPRPQPPGKRLGGHQVQGIFSAGGQSRFCALGRGGISCRKREGDGATPLGRFALSGYHVRPGLFQRLPAANRPVVIRKQSGWCDDPDDASYNRPVRLPHPASHEKLWRDDQLYDCFFVMDYNYRQRMRGRGSAIFFHIARDNLAPTQGCVAIARAAMARLVPRLARVCVLCVGC